MLLIIGDKISTIGDRTPTHATGFFSQFATATRNFGHKPSFWLPVGNSLNCGVKKPDFWQIFCTATRYFGHKPSFWLTLRQSRETGFLADFLDYNEIFW